MEELSPEASERLEVMHSELVKVLKSYESLEKSKEWTILKELVFSRSERSIERQILNEALSPKIDTDKLYKLQGELAWAKQYTDTERFTENLKLQLENINKRIK